MKQAATPWQPSNESDWFTSWFDSAHYRALYAHRDDREAAGFIDRLVKQRVLAGGTRVLDLGCGTGRHARHLASRGFTVTGVDLSGESLRQAKLSAGPNLRFVRQDMRLPIRTGPFDYVLNLFTSFGYFDDPADHMSVVHNLASSLKPGGSVVLDYLNIRYVDTNLVPEETLERDGIIYRLSRWSSASHICKRIAIEGNGAAAPVEYTERVAKLTIEDFRFMFALSDMTIQATYGDYSLAPFEEGSSPRLIMVASRTPGESSAPGYLRDSFLRMRLTVSGDMPRYDASIDCGTRSAIEG